MTPQARLRKKGRIAVPETSVGFVMGAAATPFVSCWRRCDGRSAMDV